METSSSGSHSASEPHAPPEGADAVFGATMGGAVAFARLLADTGVEHGLIGPREVPRLWNRHILNCAVIAELIPKSAVVADIGSGAGLPGLAVAIARPDVTMHLIEPLHRRTQWLDNSVRQLGLENVTVHRARAEVMAGAAEFDVVTARAVARLAKLAAWSAPLLRPGGELIALKGASAATEIDEDAKAIARAGGTDVRLETVGERVLDEPSTVVRIAFPGRKAAGRRAKRRA